MEKLRNKLGFICDMDGVIYHGNTLLNGVVHSFVFASPVAAIYTFLQR